MRFPYLVISFFILFFALQLFFGEAGIIAFVQEKYIAQKVAENVVMLHEIQKNLKKKEHLAHVNRSYMRMNAHRVGLLSDNEYLITLDSPLFTESVSYSPGTVLADKRTFYVSNAVLFFLALAIYSLALTLYILKRNFAKSDNAISDTTGNADDMNIPSHQLRSVLDANEESQVFAMNSETSTTILSDAETISTMTRHIYPYRGESDQMEESLKQASI